MEQITLTKDELKEIVENAVNRRMKYEAAFKPNKSEVFKATKLQSEDFQKINISNDYIKGLKCGNAVQLGYPISTKVFSRDFRGYAKRSKVNSETVHDLIRKLSLSVFGYSLNSDLEVKDLEKVNELYSDFKEFYLLKYQERVEKLDIWDFE